MAHNIQLADQAANAEANGVAALLNNGFVDIYDGSQPANANTALSGQTRLAHVAFGATAFAGAIAGVATANALTDDASAVGGAAAWFRATKSDASAVFDGTVGVGSGFDLNIDSVTIVTGADVHISAATLTAPEA